MILAVAAMMFAGFLTAVSVSLPQVESDSPMKEYWAMLASDDRHFESSLERNHWIFPAAG